MLEPTPTSAAASAAAAEPAADPSSPVSTSSAPGASPAARLDDRSLQVPLCFVSLLRKGTPDRDRSEAKLAAAYDNLMAKLNREFSLPVKYVALDWHELDKQLGHDGEWNGREGSGRARACSIQHSQEGGRGG